MRKMWQQEQEEEPMAYIDKCKIIGRVGPATPSLDTVYGDVYNDRSNKLDIEALSRWASVRCNVGVFSGRYYFEVQLKTAGVMQIGWASLHTVFNS
mmetsp:Transcript_39090/g.59613  ORF Transcript_39090/g.59613 Transcript_39090/m.59613 type:complete len:96 (+) Transcript_39090:542-829(+)